VSAPALKTEEVPMHRQATEGNESMPATKQTIPCRSLRTGLLMFALVALAGVAGQASPAAGATNPCVKQCAVVGQACLVPFRLAFQVQRTGCTGIGKKLCILAAKVMFSAGRQLCRSTQISCRKCCQKGAPLCSSTTCGDGMLAPNEECDPPGWAACTNGAACGADCLCPPAP
jgi:hypothetical protein